MLRPSPLPDQRAAADACMKAVEAQFAVFRDKEPEQKGYLLFERGLHRRLGKLADAQLTAYKHAVLFENTPEAHLARDHSPWLVELWDLPGPILLHQLALTSQQYAALAWIWSPLPLAQLADHLRAFMGATLWNDKTGEEEGEIALRCTDPRVFPGILEALLPEQRTALLRPLRAWALWDRHLQWRIWEGPADATPAPPEPLRISLGQLGVMNRHTQPDKIISLLDDEYGHGDNAVRDQLLQLPADERYRTVWNLIEEAHRFGYRSDQDLMLFTSLACLLHRRFFELPTFSQALRQGGAQGEPLAATVNGLPDRAWQEVEVALAAQYADLPQVAPPNYFSRAY